MSRSRPSTAAWPPYRFWSPRIVITASAVVEVMPDRMLPAAGHGHLASGGSFVHRSVDSARPVEQRRRHGWVAVAVDGDHVWPAVAVHVVHVQRAVVADRLV